MPNELPTPIPTPGFLELAAENAVLREEVETLEGDYPKWVSFSESGTPLPNTVEEFNGLPEPWRRQVATAHPTLLDDLINKNTIVAQAQAVADLDAWRRQRLIELECPVQSSEEFAALPAEEREELALTLTEEQRDVLLGVAKPEHFDEGYI